MYAARGIVEYWIVDPIQQQVTILELVEGFYEEKVYQGSERLDSPLLTQIDLTVEQVL
ncbi:Uma2 family endonuclease [Pleurocapsa sp. FMAR1]|uniref:Uma2 family endonuclease n=1 Tax=Pleurocapsa sp. FMAR1 TaxID=3040204 RepID=UPI0029C6CF8E|nr:Uma2 family endonuclease [Pleurocapsa sp. FMAR1]